MLHYWLSSLFVLTMSVSCFQTSRYIKDALCDIDDRLRNGCAQKLTKVHSLLHCASLCDRWKEDCRGASVDEDSVCYVHMLCPAVGPCVQPTTNHKYITRKCVHGYWDPTSFSCECDKGFAGQRCEKYPQDCEGAYNLGVPQGEQKAFLDPDQDGYSPVPVVCDIWPPGWFSVILMRNEGSVDFNRTWLQYQRGFFEDFKNLWLGLDTWRILSQAGYSSNLVVNFKDARSIHRKYTDMVFQTSSDWFRFTFGGSVGGGDTSLLNNGISFEDCLGPLQNTHFSTWDRDNDGDSLQNCASSRGRGWWYTQCASVPCNLFGWGYSEWANTPVSHRLSLPGITMNAAFAQSIGFVEIYLK